MLRGVGTSLLLGWALTVSIGGCAGSSGTGSASGGGSGGVAGGGGTGGANPICTALLDDHGKQLALAKECARFAAPAPQCTLDVASDLICGCPIRVEASNTQALTALDSIKQQWVADGCAASQPPCAADCAAPSSGSCEAGGQGGDVGVCVTQY